MLQAVVLCCACAVAAAHAGPLRVRAASVDNARERQGVQQIRRLVAGYAVEPWLFTDEIVVQSGAVPHSHPVLILNTRALDEDIAALATLLHEQFHWYVDALPQQRVRAVQAFRKRFPDAPSRGPEGAADQDSTYLHLVVCDLELQAMTALVGERRARAVLADNDHYTWIYRQVLDNPDVRRINRDAGLLLPDAKQAATVRAAIAAAHD